MHTMKAIESIASDVREDGGYNFGCVEFKVQFL